MNAAPAKSPAPRRSIRILLDAHVHIYPSYDLPALLLAALDRMPRRSPTDQRVLCLAERRDCSFFQALAQDEIALPPDLFRITAWDPDGAVKIRHIPSSRDLWIVAGRQFATAERIEVCSLFSDLPVPEGLPARRTIEAIRAQGALPLLNWGFGKWLGARRALVLSLLRDFAPADLPLVDVLGRPRLTPLPAPFRLAARQNRPVLHGTDPLPKRPASEALLPGSYHSVFTIPFPEDPTRLVPALRSFLAAPTSPILPAGSRLSLLPALLRR